MLLWLLERKGPIGYDQFEGFVVRADSEEAARKLASECTYSEKEKAVWLLEKATTCQYIGEGRPEDTEPEVILSAFNAG